MNINQIHPVIIQNLSLIFLNIISSFIGSKLLNVNFFNVFLPILLGNYIVIGYNSVRQLILYKSKITSYDALFLSIIFVSSISYFLFNYSYNYILYIVIIDIIGNFLFNFLFDFI